MHMSVYVWSVGAQCAFFDKHLKTHDQNFTMKYLSPKLSFEHCSKIIKEVHQMPFFRVVLGVGVMCKKEKN